MNTYTTIGAFEDRPEEPIVFVVKADDTMCAIREAELDAKAISETTFLNLFVFEGEPKLLTSWAG